MTSLEGQVIRLVPASMDYAEGLYRVATPDVFEHFLRWPENGTIAAFETFYRAEIAAPREMVVAIVKATGEAAGVSGFLPVGTHDKALEVGGTWFAKKHWGTAVNVEAKYLMLREAFEHRGVERLQIKTDARNLRSRRAIEKLGAQPEGILRRYQRVSDGRLRDTAMYSLVRDEWPAAKISLEARLASLL